LAFFQNRGPQIPVSDKIRVLIVDDIEDTTTQVARLLSFESDVEVVGTATNSAGAIEAAHKQHPDLILMDINMPDVDGIATTEALAREVPSAAVIMMSVQAEGDYLRRSMRAGARGYLVKPFTSDELLESIRGVEARRVETKGSIVAVGPGTAPVAQQQAGRVIAVYSPKGGVGSTTLAVNLAIAVAQMKKSVVLVDADLQFGDVGVLLNLDPSQASLADLAAELGQGNAESVEGAVLRHHSGVDVVLAPATPDAAELVGPTQLRTLLEALAGSHELVIVDCATYLNDTTLTILDVADEIVCPMSLDITTLRSTRVFLDVAEQLGYPHEKLTMVLNRADSNHGIRVEDVERSLGRKVDHMVVSDGRAAVHALNTGVPFVLGNRRARVSEDVVALAQALFAEHDQASLAAGPVPRPERRLALARR
jgi:pilus assembly protein CpaE